MVSNMSVEAASGNDSHQRPIQTLSWSEKNDAWYQSNINHYISRSNFNLATTPGGRKDLRTLYGVYNNQFPLEWFSHVTDPLSAKAEQHKKFPARVRPVTIIRTNIDLLLGEYPRRPFVYNVSNLGDSGYSRFMEGMKQQATSTLTDFFMRGALEEMQAAGQELTPELLQKLQQDPPVPEEVKAQFKSSYKDSIAIKAQKYLRRTIREEEVKRKFHRMFKDWLIAGECYSYKGIENDKLVYRKVSPLSIDYDKSSEQDFIEDGEWVVAEEWLVLSDVVDKFYSVLKEKHLKDLEKNYHYQSPSSFYDYLKGSVSSMIDKHNKIPVYHVQWKGRKKIGFLSYMDMETFQMVEEVVDENYIVDKAAGEKVEWRWVNEVYEGWRITDKIFCNMQPCPVQRNEMNNHSTCKLSYNGRKYSDTHSENLSVLEIGIPFQIMYILTNYTLEKTIAKSKGKILMMDQKTIPDDGDWDEEKFFYYAEALGYALIDRSQPGVDKTWNQYQVLDMSLFDQIKQLIEIMDWIKQQWDDVIGITRQRKGQTYASDGVGSNERAVFQSTVITDMIFLGFEEFTERELQGFMDLSKFTTSKGVYGMYNDDDFGTSLLEIQPEDFMNEEIGIFIMGAAEELRKLGEMKQYAQAMVQNGSKPSTVLEVIDSINVAELKQKLRQIEDIQAQQETATQDAEHNAEAAADERMMRMKRFESLLDREKMHEEYGEKQEIEHIKGMYNTFTFQDGDSNDNGVPDAIEVQKMAAQREQMNLDFKGKQEDRKIKLEKIKQDQVRLDHDIKQADKDTQLKKEKLKIDRKKALQRPAAKKK